MGLRLCLSLLAGAARFLPLLVGIVAGSVGLQLRLFFTLKGIEHVGRSERLDDVILLFWSRLFDCLPVLDRVAGHFDGIDEWARVD